MENISTEEETYIQYILSIIEKYKDSYTIIYNDEISPYLINEVLANYNNIFDKLNMEYQRCKKNEYTIKCEFDDWWDESFSLVRKEMVEKIPAGNKNMKISVTEFENETKVRYKDVYRSYRNKLNDVELKTSYMRRALENWKKVDSILNTLSNNLRSEMKSMSLITRINRNNNDQKDTNERKVR